MPNLKTALLALLATTLVVGGVYVEARLDVFGTVARVLFGAA